MQERRAACKAVPFPELCTSKSYATLPSGAEASESAHLEAAVEQLPCPCGLLAGFPLLERAQQCTHRNRQEVCQRH